MFTKSKIKDIKSNLQHLNEIHLVFKLEAIQKNLEGDSIIPFMQEKLRSYLKDSKTLITEEQIKESKIKLKELMSE